MSPRLVRQNIQDLADFRGHLIIWGHREDAREGAVQSWPAFCTRCPATMVVIHYPATGETLASGEAFHRACTGQ